MSYQLSILERAEDDYRSIYRYIAARSLVGAANWEAAFQSGIQRVVENPFAFGLAPENGKFDIELRQLLFGTKKGLTYRVVFTILGDTVYLLRLRGPGQRPIQKNELL